MSAEKVVRVNNNEELWKLTEEITNTIKPWCEANGYSYQVNYNATDAPLTLNIKFIKISENG